MKDEEKALLQRKIKNQRRALKLLNRHIEMQALAIDRWGKHGMLERAYRHAAQIAEGMLGGGRIARRIREWL